MDAVYRPESHRGRSSTERTYERALDLTLGSSVIYGRQPAEQRFQQGGDATQLPPVGGGKSRERPLTGGGERQEGAAAVAGVLPAYQVAPAREPIDQADGAVVAGPEPLRQIPDRRLGAARVALDGEQRLVLARGEARRMRRLLAECCEAHQ